MKHDTLQHLSWLHQVNLVKVLPRLRMTIQCNVKLSTFTPCIPRKNEKNNLYPISQFSFQLDFIYFTTPFCFLPYFALFLAFFILSLPFSVTLFLLFTLLNPMVNTTSNYTEQLWAPQFLLLRLKQSHKTLRNTGVDLGVGRRGRGPPFC